MTPEQKEWLADNRIKSHRDRWLGSSNAMPMIREMIEQGLMQPAYGEFGQAIDKGEKLEVLGRAIPVTELTSLYTLTQRGRALYYGYGDPVSA